MSNDNPSDASTATASLITLLTDPAGFFAERADSPSLAGPTLVVLFTAAVGLAGSLPILRATTSALPEQTGLVSTFVYASSVIGGVLGVLIVWLLYAVVLHVTSAAVFGAEGGFRDTLALTGWGFVPRIPEGILSAAVTYVVFTGVTFPSDPLQTSRFIRQLRNDPLLELTGWLSLVFLAWSAMLWTFAIRHGRGLTLREAALTVAVPVGMRLLLFVLGQVGAFTGLLLVLS